MHADQQKPRPRHFFLNEEHELAPGEKAGGGRVPHFVGIDWQAKGTRISSSLARVRERIRASIDPLRDSRYFVLALPTAKLEKVSEDRRKAPDGTLSVDVDYAQADSRVFARLGLDLIQVHADGTAMVHAPQERFQNLLLSSNRLDQFGPREKARWATLDSFDVVQPEHKVDLDWLKTVKSSGSSTEAVIELQPLLTTLEVDKVIRAIADVLIRSAGEGLKSIGTDFSGRKWLRGLFGFRALEALISSFFSIQTIHPPLYAVVLNSAKRRQTQKQQPAVQVSSRAVLPAALPCVAVVDTGVPKNHCHLAQYKRGEYVAPPPALGSPVGDHGSTVASRVVFGDLDCSDADPVSPEGECSFYDVNIATSPTKIDEKSVLPALEALVGVAPDVRVFNFSFDNNRPLDSELPNLRREKLILVQDLDNFIFARDVLVVVAAGNSPPGIIPATPYPKHADDPNWALGTWPRSFNGLTCGSFIERLHGDGLASEVGAPSPFTKAGPGLCQSPNPDIS